MAYRRILCAVDFSDNSNAAFYRAVSLANQFSSHLFLLHAIEVQPLVSQWVQHEGLSTLTMEIENRAQEAMDALVNSVKGELGEIDLKTEITSGRAFTEILENARVWKADLIVLGSRGSGSLEDAALGSTVDRVVAESDCSVLVVKS